MPRNGEKRVRIAQANGVAGGSARADDERGGDSRGRAWAGVLLAAGRRGAVGHGYAVGCTARVWVGRAAGLLHLRGQLI